MPDVTVRKMTGCSGVTGTKGAPSTAHPSGTECRNCRNVLIPNEWGNVSGKACLLYRGQRSHITKSSLLLLLESIQSRLPTRQRGFLLLPLLPLRLHFQTALHSVSDDFLLVQKTKVQLKQRCWNLTKSKPLHQCLPRLSNFYSFCDVNSSPELFFCHTIYHMSLDTDPLVLVSHLLLAPFNTASRTAALFPVLGNKFFFGLRIVALRDLKKKKSKHKSTLIESSTQ